MQNAERGRDPHTVNQQQLRNGGVMVHHSKAEQPAQTIKRSEAGRLLDAQFAAV